MTPNVDSLDAMRPEETRALVVALLDRLGGEVTLNEGELVTAYLDHTRVVQVEVADFPRTARVRLLRGDVVTGTVTA